MRVSLRIVQLGDKIAKLPTILVASWNGITENLGERATESQEIARWTLSPKRFRINPIADPETDQATTK